MDLSAQVKDDMFELWLKKCTDEALEDHKKTDPIFKLWHLVGSMESHSCEQSLLSFYELDSPTKVEVNIAKNNKNVNCWAFSDFALHGRHMPERLDLSSVSNPYNSIECLT